MKEELSLVIQTYVFDVGLRMLTNPLSDEAKQLKDLVVKCLAKI